VTPGTRSVLPARSAGGDQQLHLLRRLVAGIERDDHAREKSTVGKEATTVGLNAVNAPTSATTAKQKQERPFVLLGPVTEGHCADPLAPASFTAMPSCKHVVADRHDRQLRVGQPGEFATKPVGLELLRDGWMRVWPCRRRTWYR